VSIEPGVLYVVATPIGNLEDITRRAVTVLAEVDAVAAEDTRHSRRLLDHLSIATPLLSLHEHNERAATERVLERLHRGESLALISDAGTPLISDPGFPLVRECRRQGLGVIPIPGPSALIAALSVAGLPTDRFRFEGFLPRRPQARRERLAALVSESATLVFYESSHRLPEALDDLVAVFGPQRRACIARELTKLHETLLDGELGGLQARVRADPNQQKGEIVLLLAGAAETPDAQAAEIDRQLRILLRELPVRQAAALVAELTGERRNRVYPRALALHSGED
jgi:16S rRNA (cytidine1402-2'-O)-methyltransferase